VNFLTDLIRRRVFRTAAIYAAVAWGLTEALTTVAEKLLLPDWVGMLIVIAFLVGFPVAMYLAWVFDITVDGIRRTQPTSMKGWMAMTLSAVLLVGGTATLFWLIYPGERMDESALVATEQAVDLPEDTIAVLPFWNATGEESAAYYADGIAETLLGELAGVASIRVIARDSSFAMRDRQLDLRTKARRLNAGYLLDGSVQRAGDVIRIIARLVDGETGEYVWAETYDGSTADVFDIQDAIALAVVSRLDPTHTQETVLASVASHTADPAAFDHYLQGLYLLNAGTPEELAEAAAQFTQAIDLDPEFALAYVGRVNAHAFASAWELPDSNEVFASIRRDLMDYFFARTGQAVTAQLLPLVEEDIQRALELAPDLAEAHVADGLLRMMQRDYRAAEVSLLRALELKPSFAPGLHIYGLYLREVNRFAESYEVLGAAMSLDSQSYALRFDYADASFWVGELEQGARLIESLIASEPHRVAGHQRRAGWRLDTGRAAEGIEELFRAAEDPDVRRFLFGGDALSYLSQYFMWQNEPGALEYGRRLMEMAPDEYPLKHTYLQLARCLARDDEVAFDAFVAAAEDRGLDALHVQTLSICAGRAVAYGRFELALELLDAIEPRVADLDWPHAFQHFEFDNAKLDSLTRAAALLGLGQQEEAHELARDALRWLDEAEANGLRHATLDVVRAKAHSLLGDQERALELLEPFLSNGSPWTYPVDADGTLSALADDPRFVELMATQEAIVAAEVERAYAAIDAYVAAHPTPTSPLWPTAEERASLADR
jgi:TolB-like protein